MNPEDREPVKAGSQPPEQRTAGSQTAGAVAGSEPGDGIEGQLDAAQSSQEFVNYGLSIAIPLVPGEDLAVYQARLNALVEKLAPENQIELDLVVQFAAVTWSNERVRRAQAATHRMRVRRYALEKEQAEKEEALALGSRLLDGLYGLCRAIYPELAAQFPDPLDQESDGFEGLADAEGPAALLLRLESTTAGCSWLMDRWNMLRRTLEGGGAWTPPQQFMAIRMLGKQPFQIFKDHDVSLICQACARLDDDGDPFQLVRMLRPGGAVEGIDGQLAADSKALIKWPSGSFQPAGAAASREALKALVARQQARLRLLLARNQELAEADVARAPDRLAAELNSNKLPFKRQMRATSKLAKQTMRTFLAWTRCRAQLAQRRAEIEDADESAETGAK